MIDTILFATVGRSDLQLLVTDQGGETFRAEVDRSCARAWHQSMHENKLDYCVQLAHAAADRARRFKWDPVQMSLIAPSLTGDNESVQPVKDEHGRWILVPAKLASIVNDLLTNYRVVGAVLFNTYRTSARIGPRYQEEPFLTGRILSRWLADRFNIEAGTHSGHIGPGISGWVDFLDGGLELSGDGRDTPLNREAARRIDRSFLQAIAEGSKTAEVHAYLALGGGIPEIKDVLVASARYRFQNRVLLRTSRDDNDNGIEPTEDIPTAQESLRSRHQAGLHTRSRRKISLVYYPHNPHPRNHNTSSHPKY